MSLTQTEHTLSIEQQSAVDLCTDLGETIVSVTGGAGVGKTLVLGEVYKELKSLRKRVVLCAPTGRAAKRIEELTGIKAKTIHRLLQFPQWDDVDTDPDTSPNEPKRNRQTPLDENVVIVDEASMLAPTLFRQLMDAIPRDGIIRFFGDNNQLPPVEEGLPPFITMLEEKPSVELTYNYRSGDMILGNAARILQGRVPLRNDRFEIIYTDSNHAIPTLLNFIKGEKIFASESHQIIMPTRRGNYGTDRVNPSLQMKFNPRGEMLRLDRFGEKDSPLAVRAKDKFIWIKNDYKLELFNGELGYIDWVDTDEGSLGLVTGTRAVEVPARIKTYNAFIGTVIDYDPRKQLELGYAITTHKSQGSEFHTVIVCMCRGQTYLLNRRNFYTAVTRAKEQVILIMDRQSMHLALRRYKS